MMRLILSVIAALAFQSVLEAAEVGGVIFSDADQQQLFGDDGMMDQCMTKGGIRCQRVQQLILLRMQEANQRAQAAAETARKAAADDAANKAAAEATKKDEAEAAKRAAEPKNNP